VLAVNLQALIEAALNADGVIEFTHRVGDFIATGDNLFRLYGGAKTIDDPLLRAQLARAAPARTARPTHLQTGFTSPIPKHWALDVRG
jgi:uncharacterized membrane protein